MLNKELLPQHKISLSFLYHLFPGFSVFLSFLLINNSIIQLGFNSNISLAISFLFVGIPIQLFIIFKKGYNINGKLSLDKVIFYRTKIPAFQLFLYVLLFIPYAFMVVLYIEPINNFILQNYFYWIPESFNIENSQINNNLTITIVGFTLLIFIDGVLNPIVEELYFRGFLMPRLSRYLYFSAFISAFLFFNFSFLVSLEYFTNFFNCFTNIYYRLQDEKYLYLNCYPLHWQFNRYSYFSI